jgi:hypothetical protein
MRCHIEFCFVFVSEDLYSHAHWRNQKHSLTVLCIQLCVALQGICLVSIDGIYMIIYITLVNRLLYVLTWPLYNWTVQPSNQLTRLVSLTDLSAFLFPDTNITQNFEYRFKLYYNGQPSDNFITRITFGKKIFSFWSILYLSVFDS